jgi:hypothetical protein
MRFTGIISLLALAGCTQPHVNVRGDSPGAVFAQHMHQGLYGGAEPAGHAAALRDGRPKRVNERDAQIAREEEVRVRELIDLLWRIR